MFTTNLLDQGATANVWFKTEDKTITAYMRVATQTSQVVLEGHSTCHEGDPFNAKYGRALAFSRLMAGPAFYLLGRENRRILWNNYFACSNQANKIKPRPSGLDDDDVLFLYGSDPALSRDDNIKIAREREREAVAELLSSIKE